MFLSWIAVRDQREGDRGETHLQTRELDVHSIKCQLEGVLLDEVCHFAHNIVGGRLVLRALPMIKSSNNLRLFYHFQKISGIGSRLVFVPTVLPGFVLFLVPDYK